MEYGNNILKTDSAYYELKNASISRGVLSLKPGGYAKCTITEQYIAKATEYFRVNLVVDAWTDNYEPKTRVDIHFVAKDSDESFNYTLFPTANSTGIFTQDIQLKSGDYDSFIFEITAKEQISFLVWELCPEAADEDIETIIEGVEQSLPRLLYDYNTWPLSVQQDEKTIGLITFRLLDHTDLQGHFQLTYVASEACTLTLRFKDNGATELFSPILYDLHAGRGSVGVPHAYLERLTGIHSVIVTAQVSSGTLAINARGILFTIDGGYLAERMLDIGVDMQDISMRQLSEDYGPDEIWIVGIEAGEAIVRSRKYDPKATIGFTPQYSLGPAQRAAIEFDGDWILRDGNILFTIETEEEPWTFWIDPDDDMYAQHGANGDAILLDKNVSDLYVCKGYSSTVYLEQDQGLVVAYVKSGKVYYRQYALDVTLMSKKWLDVCEIDPGISNAKSISVARLNDYRLAFTVSLPETTKTYITDRTYVNQAVPIETAVVSILPSTHTLYCPADTNLSVSANLTAADDLLTFYVNINRRLRVFTDDLLELITFNKSINIEMIKKVTYKNYSDSSIITITLKEPPKGLITEVYINATQSSFLQCEIQSYGTIICPYLNMSIDTTIYTKDKISIERAPLKASMSFAYKAVFNTTKSYTEQPSIQAKAYHKYQQAVYKHQAITESTGIAATCTFAYTMSGKTPI